jgi:hypothetical protein
LRRTHAVRFRVPGGLPRRFSRCRRSTVTHNAHHFEEIIARTEEHFCNPEDLDYIDFSALPPSGLLEFAGALRKVPQPYATTLGAQLRRPQIERPAAKAHPTKLDRLGHPSRRVPLPSGPHQLCGQLQRLAGHLLIS